MKIPTRHLITTICAALLAGPAFAADPAEKADPPATKADAGEAKSSMIDPVCKQLSEDILDALVKGDYAAARVAFNGDMTKQLTEAKLQEAWESLLPRFGVPKMRGEPQGKRGDGMAVIYTPLKFDKANLVSQVACDGNNKVAGFYVVPEMPPKPAENMKPIEY